MDLGEHLGRRVAVDGTPEPGSKPGVSSMQLVNHSCAPNCVADHKDFGQELWICYLTATRNIFEGEQITFRYGGDFWRSGRREPNPGAKLVVCKCGTSTCKRPWRWERRQTSRGVTIAITDFYKSIDNMVGSCSTQEAAASRDNSASCVAPGSECRTIPPVCDCDDTASALALEIIHPGATTGGLVEVRTREGWLPGSESASLRDQDTEAAPPDGREPDAHLSATSDPAATALIPDCNASLDAGTHGRASTTMVRVDDPGDVPCRDPERDSRAEEVTARAQHMHDPPKDAGITAPAVTTPSTKADLALAPYAGTTPGYLQQDPACSDPVMDVAGGGMGTQPQATQLSVCHDASGPQDGSSGWQASGVSAAAPLRDAAEVFQPWRPGTRVHYMRPRGGPTRAPEKGFPVWEVPGDQPQQAMFAAADLIAKPAFYVAADQWNGDKIVKVFGAFATAQDFLQVLKRSPIRCYYELIRADLPCKAYLDVEGEKGALTSAQGALLLHDTVTQWFALIEARWPGLASAFPKTREVIVLDGSRTTAAGIKVSYHIIFPWITFVRNDGALQDLVRELSTHPGLQYVSRSGERKIFVDDQVYTRNRQFRTVLSWKLDDRTTTGLHIRGAESDRRLLQSFVTRIEAHSWRAPEKAVPRDPSFNLTHRLRPPRGRPTLPGDGTPLIGSLRQLLAAEGHQSGQLTPMQNNCFR